MGRPLRRLRDQLRPLRSTPLFPLLSVFTGGAIGYRLSEGWDWGDCFWGVLITLTTVGYGDQVPNSMAGRWVTAAILFGGLVVVQQTLQWLLGLQERPSGELPGSSGRHRAATFPCLLLLVAGCCMLVAAVCMLLAAAAAGSERQGAGLQLLAW